MGDHGFPSSACRMLLHICSRLGRHTSVATYILGKRCGTRFPPGFGKASFFAELNLPLGGKYKSGEVVFFPES